MNAKEMIQLLESETDTDELYSHLIDCGKKYPWIQSDKDLLKKVILKFCSHTDAQIRGASIRVLCFYWMMEEYRDKAWEMYSNEKEDEGTRSDALMSWSNTYSKTNKQEIIKILYKLLKDKSLPMIIRASCYSNILLVSKTDVKDWPNTDIDWDNFDADIDWGLVNKILEESNPS